MGPGGSARHQSEPGRRGAVCGLAVTQFRAALPAAHGIGVEYAARAGTMTRYSWGDEIGVNRANCRGCGSPWDGRRTAPVGSFAPNGFDLYDMHGNVWEWVQDCHNGDYSTAPSDGTADVECRYTGSVQLMRGGSFLAFPTYVRSAYRMRYLTTVNSIGFRVARDL